MHTIKRYLPGEEIASVTLKDGSTVTLKATITSFGIIDGAGKLTTTTSRLTGKVQPEIYVLKSAAQQQADWYNKQAN